MNVFCVRIPQPRGVRWHRGLNKEVLSPATRFSEQGHPAAHTRSSVSFSQSFNSNDYFDNAELWKEITFADNGEAEVTQSGVKWKPGKV